MKRTLSQAILLVFFLAIASSSIAYAEYTLQLATYPYKSNAERHVKALAEQDYDAFIHVQERDTGGFYYKVRLGPFETMEATLDQKESMLANGYKGDILLVESQTENHAKRNLNGDRFEETLLSDSKPSQEVPSSPIGEPHSGTEPDAEVAGEAIPTPIPEANGRKIKLEWDPDPDPNLSGYRIYYDTDPDSPYAPDESYYANEGPPPLSVSKDSSSVTLNGLRSDSDYYFWIAAANASGNESMISEGIHLPKKEPTPPKGQQPSVASTQPSEEPRQSMLAEKTAPSVQKRKIRNIRKHSYDRRKSKSPKKPIPKGDSSANPDAAETETESIAIIEPGDVIRVLVPGQKEMSSTYDVAPDGHIYMMVMGKVHTRGLSENQLSEKLQKVVKQYIDKGERVSVKILDRMRFVNIVGGVKYPGWYRVPPVATLKRLLDTAGGPLTSVDNSQIKLMRRTGNEFEDIPFEGDISIRSDDVLSVPRPTTFEQRVDSGDLLFISIPMRDAPTKRHDSIESSDLKEELIQNQLEVDKNGYLYIPNIGHINVDSRTAEEIRQIILSRMPKYLARSGGVKVNIISKKQFVQALGHIKNPGWYNISETGNAQEAISAAGGTIDGAVLSDAKIQRRIGLETVKVKVNLYQFIITGDERLLTPLHENDIIFVPIAPTFGSVKRTLMPWTPPPQKLETDIKNKVRIFGSVFDPGNYEPVEDMNLLDIIITAGGARENADLSKILIIRENKVDERINLEEFLKNPDSAGVVIPGIRAGDIVYVNFVELTIFEPKEDELFYVLGEVEHENEHKLANNMTIPQAIALAGGFEEFADREHIMILRWVNGRQENIPYNFHKGIAGKLPERNITVYP